MLKTRILKNPLWVQTESHLYGTHSGGWSHQLESPGTLPQFGELIEKLPASAWESSKAALFLPEIACFPLKVEMAHKVGLRERENYIKWNLKKRLPFPSEDALIRYLPLGDSSTWLVFSLPGSWVEEAHAFFKQKGIQLGYIGTISGLFLERLKVKSSRILLAYRHFYTFIQREAGRLTHFSLRRFPEEGGQILFPEFFPQDFPEGGNADPLQVISFCSDRNVEWSMFRDQDVSSPWKLMEAEENLARFLVTLAGRA